MVQTLTAVPAKLTIDRLSLAVHASLLASFIGLVGFVALVCSHTH
jgi:hypothetical protein